MRKRTRIYRAPVVITLSASTLALTGCAEPRPTPPTAVPPPVEQPVLAEQSDAGPGASSEPDAALSQSGSGADAATAAGTAKRDGPLSFDDLRRYSVTRNAQHPQHGTIYREHGPDQCYVRLPFPPGTKLTSYRPSPTKGVACPASMKDPGWSACPGGEIHATPEGDDCACTSDGNPPPPPRRITCPK